MVVRARRIALWLVLLSIAAIVGLMVLTVSDTAFFGHVIGVIHIDGPIQAERSGGLMAQPGGRFLEQFQAAEKDGQMEALIIRINSSGGSSAASQELHAAVRRIAASGRPVVVSMADAAASGAYYIAAGADFIMANPSTITGSIGVVMEFQDVQGLLDMVGVDIELLTAGEHKGAGHPARGLTDMDRELLSEVIFDAWDQFVSDVATGRSLSRAEVEAFADGRLLTGRQAQDAGLVDALGGFAEAVAKAKELANLTEPVVLRSYGQRPSLWQQALVGVVDSLVAVFPQLGELAQPTVRLRF